MSTLNVATTGLIAFSKAMQMTSHNIANANTKGFIKSQAAFRELPSYGQPPIGTGVAFDKSLADEFLKLLDDSIYDQTGDVGYQQGLKDALGLIPEDGVDNMMQSLANFQNAMKELVNDPDNLAVKANVLDAANQFTSSVNTYQNTLLDIANTSNESVERALPEVNGLLQGIAQQLRDGQDPRADIETLSEYIGVNFKNGQLTATNGMVLISNGQAKELKPADITYGTGGYLGGLKRASSDIIPGLMVTVHQATEDYVNRVNDKYYDGTYLRLFETKDINFGVVPTMPALIKAGPEAGNNINAMAIVNLLDSPGSTGAGIKADLLSTELSLSNAKNNNVNSLERESALLDKLVSDRDDKYGVNLDVEAVNMLKYQRAYEAMAKVIQADNAMFNSLLAVV